MGSGAAGQPMNSDNTSWPFTSPAGKDAAKPPKPHEIDLYIEPSPRDSPTALPKLFTTLEPEPLAPAHANANAHVEEDLSSTPPSRADVAPLASGLVSASGVGSVVGESRDGAAQALHDARARAPRAHE